MAVEVEAGRPPAGGRPARHPRSAVKVSRKQWLGGAILLAFLAVVVLLPVGFVVARSFSHGSAVIETGWTTAAWQRALSSPRTLSSIAYSFLLSIRIPIGIAIAFVLAWLLVRIQIPAHRFIMYSLWFAFFLPILPVTLGWILLADANYGLINELILRLPFVNQAPFTIHSVAGILWVHLTLSTIPIMVILLSPALSQLDTAYEEAAHVAGASSRKSLIRITIPLITPAIMTAFLAGFIRSLEVFEVELLLGAPAGIWVYSTRIYNLLRELPPDFPQAMALSTMFLIFLIGLAIIYQRLMIRYGGNVTVTARGMRNPSPTRTWWTYLASALIILGLVLTILLPFVVLMLGSFNKLFGFFFIDDPWTLNQWRTVLGSRSFGQALRSSIVLGLAAAGFGTALYFVLAWVLARTRLFGRNLIGLLIWLPWAIPGVLLGVAFLNVFTTVPFARPFFGTIVPLVVVIVVQIMPLGVHMIQTSIEQVSGELEEAARLSGARSLQVMARVTFPLTIPMCITVFVLVFMAAIRDISTIVLVATPGTRTLALLMFEFAVGHRMEAAAVIGVIIALIALLITILATRLGLRLRM